MGLIHKEKRQDTQFTKSPFKKNRQAITCPVCGNRHRFYCTVTQDGNLVLCTYKWSDKQSKDGRHIHILNPSDNKRDYKVTTTPKTESTPVKANAETCDAVYTALLSDLELNPAHRDALLDERGLSDTTIANNLYASVPDERMGNQKAEELAQLYNLRGVAGFYKQSDSWQLNTSFKGFYVPYRDAQGRIVGLQIRRDGNLEPKYLWLTSVDKPEGVSSGSPLHFVKPDIARATGELLITEGALKADRISDFTDKAVVALAGVTAMTPDKVIAAIGQEIPELRKVIIAFDMDWKENPKVKAALMKMINAMEENKLIVEIPVWDAALGKGFDDILFHAERRAE